MMMLIALIALYVVQLVYVVQRWFSVTREIIDDARQQRMRRAIDWNLPSPRRA